MTIQTFKPKKVKGVVKLRREPYDCFALVELPDGSSEEIEGEYLSDYLKSIGIKNPDHVADRLWNFYKVNVKL